MRLSCALGKSADLWALLAEGYYGVGRNREAFSTFDEALKMYAEPGCWDSPTR